MNQIDQDEREAIQSEHLPLVAEMKKKKRAAPPLRLHGDDIMARPMDINDLALADMLPEDPEKEAVPVNDKARALARREKEPPDDERPWSNEIDGGSDVCDNRKEKESRVDIRIKPSDVQGMADAAIKAIAKLDIYQRGGETVDVIRDATTENDTHRIVRAEGSARIRRIPPARLRELVLSTCRFTKRKRVENPEEGEAEYKWVEATMPGEIPATIAARGEYDHIRVLDQVATYPVLRPDGTILAVSGYDAATRTVVEIPAGLVIDVPPAPSQEDARVALTILYGLVADFPFAKPIHKDAWIAMLLTLLARPAINGPTPLGLIDASGPGQGKTLLAILIGLIVLGRDPPKRPAPKTREEWPKVMLAILMAGDPLSVFDNVVGMLASDSLDIVLTSTSYKDRVLGESRDISVPIRTVFFATVNNATVSIDLTRRSIHIRLESSEERPEARSDFRFADIEGHATEHRARYLSAALTILRAYAVAGRPSVIAKSMGSYSAWTRVVRDAIVWASGEDVALTQADLREGADLETEEVAAFLTAWHDEFGSRPVLAGQVARAIEGRAELREAALGIAKPGTPLTGQVVGTWARRHRGQRAGGYYLTSGERDTHAQKPTWRVVQS